MSLPTLQFEYSPESFLASIPEMRAFPRLSLLYSTWASVVQAPGNVKIRNLHEVTRVKRTSREVKVWFREVEDVDNGQQVVKPKEEQETTFDQILFCSDADATLKVLGKDASWLERKVLGNVKVSRVPQLNRLAADAFPASSIFGTSRLHTLISTT